MYRKITWVKPFRVAVQKFHKLAWMFPTHFSSWEDLPNLFNSTSRNQIKSFRLYLDNVLGRPDDWNSIDCPQFNVIGSYTKYMWSVLSPIYTLLAEIWFLETKCVVLSMPSLQRAQSRINKVQ